MRVGYTWSQASNKHIIPQFFFLYGFTIFIFQASSMVYNFIGQKINFTGFIFPHVRCLGCASKWRLLTVVFSNELIHHLGNPYYYIFFWGGWFFIHGLSQKCVLPSQLLLLRGCFGGWTGFPWDPTWLLSFGA